MQSTRQRIMKLYRQLTSSSSSSPSMRRSETWTTSFQRPNGLSQNASRPTNDASAGNGSQIISATGSSNFRALQRSLSDIFSPNKVVIDTFDEAINETPEVAISQSPSAGKLCSSLRQPSTFRVSTPSSSDVSEATPLAVQSGQPHPKEMLRRQWSLAAVPESNSTREIQPSSVHPNVDDRPSKSRALPPSAFGATAVDENQNIVGPVVLDSSRQRHKSSESALKMAAGETTSPDHVMQVPETVFSAPSRRFWIMELLGAGERKKVRNKDINLMAPQSW